MSEADMEISVCCYKSGDFDVIIRRPSDGAEVTLSGNKRLDGEQMEVLDELAPACVFTRYNRAPNRHHTNTEEGK